MKSEKKATQQANWYLTIIDTYHENTQLHHFHNWGQQPIIGGKYFHATKKAVNPVPQGVIVTMVNPENSIGGAISYCI